MPNKCFYIAYYNVDNKYKNIIVITRNKNDKVCMYNHRICMPATHTRGDMIFLFHFVFPALEKGIIFFKEVIKRRIDDLYVLISHHNISSFCARGVGGRGI